MPTFPSETVVLAEIPQVAVEELGLENRRDNYSGLRIRHRLLLSFAMRVDPAA